MKPAIEGGKPTREDFLVFGKPVIAEEDIEEVVDTLRSGWIGHGPKTEQFEEMFAAYTGAKHAITVNSCTAAMYLSLGLLDLKPDDEVITSPMTYPSTANVVLHHGAKVVFADINEVSCNIDPGEVEKRITPKTRVILPVHLHGHPAEMERILDIAAKNNLIVISDAAHATEARFKDNHVGILGDAACFSFYATKNITTADGGMITANRTDWAERLRLLRMHGVTRTAWNRFTEKSFKFYDTVTPGYKLNLTDLQSALALHQMERIEKSYKRRTQVWEKYSEAFSVIEGVEIPHEPGDGRHARHLYPLRLNLDRLKINRDHFLEALKAEGIGTGIHFISLHLHSFYAKTFGYKSGDYPRAASVSERTLSLPISPGLSDEDIAD
ncbi:aminotransferase class I/II-fold pyridoxal phosphate-dependent enzyme, partial [candidate division WOR-3 bacterium]|nr:aminotransferase class I/II-fold pyridoxal phosphate-dependent enzyme [candidate division WOR-3 bacterium]MBD3364171.1 aminotransferase class I/II-fold pyridoxal phosphate-dependent enzyme [candidate division WOR-3 bacterium]